MSSKRVNYNKSLLEAEKIYPINEAAELIIKCATAKFDETIELAIKLGIDPRQTDQSVRGVVNLPHGTGKLVRVAVLAKDAKAKEAEEAGADKVGHEELLREIEAEKLDFDILITTPDMMAQLTKYSKILGPRKLMPNPKLKTVTMQVAEAVREAKFGQVMFRNDKGGIIHVGIGKVSFGMTKLLENLKFFLKELEKVRPNNAKGAYFVGAHLSSTMGVGVKFDINGFVKS
jgi:large subunit ribosomal protein L1